MSAPDIAGLAKKKGGGLLLTDHSHQQNTIPHRLQLPVLGKPVLDHQHPLKVRIPGLDDYPEHRVRLADEVLVVLPRRDGGRLAARREGLGGPLQEVQVRAGVALLRGGGRLRGRVDCDGALAEVEGLGEAWCFVSQ